MKLILLLLALVVFGLTGSANAYTFSDTIDYWNANGTSYGQNQTLSHPFDSVLVVEGSTLNYVHDITDSVLAGDQVTSASLELDFTNDLHDTVFTGLFSGLPNLTEYVSYAFNGGIWQQLGEVDNGAYEVIVDAFLLNIDGDLAVSLQVTNYDNGLGIAWLDHSILSGTAEAAPVPEPGTIILLGAGLLGLTVYSKRKNAEFPRP